MKITDNIKKLHQNISFFKSILECNKKENNFYSEKENKLKNYVFINSKSPIQSVILSGNDFVKQTANKIQNNGFGVVPILSPTVPKGQERLRICIHSFNNEQEIEKLLNFIL